MISKIENDNLIEFSPLCIGRLKKSNSLLKVLPLVDTIHLDIMDNTFVKSEAFSIEEINNFDCDKPKHVHIMSKNLEHYISKLKNVSSISFHYESTVYHNKILEMIKKKNIKAGIVFKSETQINNEVKNIIPKVDRVILMAVPPGYSGQKFIENTTNKIHEVRNLCANVHIAIDGGMNEQTMFEVTSAGANSCVVCSVIIKSDNIKKKVITLKEMCKKGSLEFLTNKNLL
ncbi:hypothetical protein IDH00_01745 [Pelagibacterales bacterium SAG-MED21]|nr:hypothetical protein [Pelagibacterales bacterium SAG-MED21]